MFSYVSHMFLYDFHMRHVEYPVVADGDDRVTLAVSESSHEGQHQFSHGGVPSHPYSQFIPFVNCDSRKMFQPSESHFPKYLGKEFHSTQLPIVPFALSKIGPI